MAKNIEINYKNEGGYEVLYPNVQTANVLDIGSFYYNKTEVDEKIQDNKDYVDGLSFKKTLVCNQAHISVANEQDVLIASNVNFNNIIGLYYIAENVGGNGECSLVSGVNIETYINYSYPLFSMNAFNSISTVPTVRCMTLFGSMDMQNNSSMYYFSCLKGIGGDLYISWGRNGSALTNITNLYVRGESGNIQGDITLYLLTY